MFNSKVAAGVAVAVLVALRLHAYIATRRMQAKLFVLARGRVCEKCGRSVQPTQLVRGVLEGERRQHLLRAINRCPCGEWTMYDDAGAAVHVDPPALPRSTELKPAVSIPVRIMCACMGLVFLVITILLALDETDGFYLLTLAVACLFFGIALFATGPPDRTTAAQWARRRYIPLRRLQLACAFAGLGGMVLAYVMGYTGVSQSWESALVPWSAGLFVIAFVLRVPVEYYAHYVDQTRDPREPATKARLWP
jgi:hypothetical protein